MKQIKWISQGKTHGNVRVQGTYSKYNYYKCKERDNFTCQTCGTKDNLDIHHLDELGPHIAGHDTDNSLTNLITLCHRCHLRRHCSTNERCEELLELRRQGYTYQYIANLYGLSRQRIHQMLNSYLK